MFKQRLISGIVLVIILALTLYFGGMATFFVTGIVSLIGYNELLKIFHIEKSALGVIGYTMAIVYYILLVMDLNNFVFPHTLLVMILLLAAYVITYPKFHFDQVMCAFFGFFYVVIMMSFIYQLRVMDNGGYYIVLLFLSAWGNDTLAYCSGMLFGKHKMSPKLSPKKTIEGAVGGVVGAGLLGLLYSLIVKDSMKLSINISLLFVIVCMVGALLSIIGDLAASAIKRNYEIKDYGTLIPGHGGILDRFDSVIFIAPIVYYVIYYALK